MEHNVNCRAYPKMHINPYFIPKPITTPHFNPNFNCKETRANIIQSQQIHINPRFVQKNQTLSSRSLLKDPVSSSTNPTTLFCNNEQDTSSIRKTMPVCASTSRYKLVNMDYHKPNQMLPTTEMATNEMHKENRMMQKVISTAVTSTTPLYKTKYCLVRSSKQQNPTKSAPSKQIQGKLVNISRYKSVVLQKILPKKAIVLPEKKSNINSYANNHLKSVHRKIDRRVRVKQKINTAATNKLNVSFRRHCTNLVTIQGQKFSATSKSLRLIGARSEKSNTDNSKSNTVKLSVRVNGRMYVQKSPNLFIRKCAAGTLKKNNIPCPSYRKYGRCVRNDRGQCALLHDKKYVVICREFLKGKCAKEDCLLSHHVSAEKMPTCSFFLQGCCTRDVCPYRHVKLSDSARVCVDFVKGYCDRGEHCPDRHVNLCPSYAERGVCTRVKCPYPHKQQHREIKRHTEAKAKTKSKNKEDVKADSLPPTETEFKSESTRYYVVDSAEHVDGEIHTSRSKLGTLPSYIKL